jgi:hypothetical protein
VRKRKKEKRENRKVNANKSNLGVFVAIVGSRESTKIACRVVKFNLAILNFVTNNK